MSISERPAEAAKRAGPGHWDVDLLFASNNSQVATLVKRDTRYVILVNVPSKNTETVVNALIKHAHTLPRDFYKALTWDRGKELGDHKEFSRRPTSMCTFAIRGIRGNVAQMRIETAC